MSIKRPWAFWRRVQYGAGVFGALLLIVAGSFLIFYEDPADCFDSSQNGLETGIDCGGACVRICAAEVFPPKIVWAESFEITDGQYNAVAYVENINDIASTEQLEYTFTLRNNGMVVAERSGITVLPPDRAYPIFEGRIDTNGQTVTDTVITIKPVAVWQPATAGPDQFKVTSVILSSADVRPRLDASIENTALTAVSNVEVVTTLFNELGRPLTASQTFIEELPGRTTRDIVFTWPRSIAKTVRSCSIPSDVVMGIDLSGSMNNDGDTPPQPITDAKTAAANFVNRLSAQDQAALVTFASEAVLQQPLTADRAAVAETITNLEIAPAEETGFTNTVAALERIKDELASDRHSSDARRAVVLLTDGLPTGAGVSEAEVTSAATALAQEIEASGAVLFVIGLGQNADRNFIESLVSDAAQAYFAPSGSDLGSIYQQITSDLCESGTTRIDVIPKTKTNFVPLR